MITCKVATYGHIPVPLVYTQVVTMAVYFYFAVSLIGEQWLIRRKRSVIIMITIITIIIISNCGLEVER